MSEVRNWLEALGLGQYAPLFAENSIDDEVLSELTDEDLKTLGISLGHRKKLLKAIAALATSAAAGAGSESGPVPQNLTDASRMSEGERRHLTVIFCDLVDSTTLAEKLDLEDYRDLIRRYQDTCAGIVSRFDGYIGQYVGDGLVVYFGFPRAHEDDAERAVRAALHIPISVGNLASGHGQALKVRIGVATGVVVVGDIIGEGASQQQAVSGEIVNLAARLQSLAVPNSVVIGAGVRELLGEQFDYEHLGPQKLKGISEPVQAWRVIAERAVETRFRATHADRLTKFFGRDHEVELLLERWRRGKAGEGQVVLLSGEAGIGKSRITETLRDRLKGEEYIRVQYQCSLHHVNSPLYPAIRQLEFAAGLSSEHTPEEKLQKLEALLEQSSSIAGAALIAALLSIPAGARYAPLNMAPQEQKHATLRVLVGMLEGLATRRPVLFMLEDAHWIDPTTRELMDLIVDRVSGLRGLAVITHRPEFQPPWSGRAHCTVLTLNRLGKSVCAALISDLTGGRELPEEVYTQIIAKTDGVPLFVEELTKTVLESGLLTQEANRFVLSGPLPPFAIPSTLQDSLMARLDRLEGTKEISQIGAAIGREFPQALLEAVSRLQGRDLDNALARLIESEIVYRRGAPPDATYVFKHALIQDTAYGTLLRGPRQQIHARIAQALRSRFSSTVDNEPELLARHYTQAALPAEAAPCWLLAGRRAVARSANLEAIAHLAQGLDVLRQLPRSGAVSSLELDMQISLGSARIAARGYSSAETAETYVRGRELLDEVGDDARQFAVLHGLCMVYWNRAQLEKNLEVAEEMLVRAERQNDTLPKLVATRVMAVVLNPLGRFADAREAAERAVNLYDPEQHRDSAHHYGHDMGVGSYWPLSIACLFLGYRDASDDAASRASALLRQLQNANTTAYNSLFAAFTSLVKGEWQHARDTATQMIEHAASRSMALWVVYGRHLLGSALAALNEAEPALAEIRRGRADAAKLSNSVFKPMTLRFEAQALATLGRFDEAFARLDEALETVEATQERWWEAEIHRIRGEISRQSKSPQYDAEASFRRAIDVARDQQAKLFELRAATSLGRLWQEAGKNSDARVLIAPLYKWFTEGLDSPDLQNARALLDDLSR